MMKDKRFYVGFGRILICGVMLYRLQHNAA